jgi:hypothetical protein
VRTWTEIMTGQDLDPNHRVYDAESVGAGLTFVEPAHDGALGFKIATSHVLPLRPPEWAAVLGLVRDGKEPPLEEVLSRDARAAQRRGANRRAIIDAATALEIALGQHVRSQVAQLPEISVDVSAIAERFPWLTIIRAVSEEHGYSGECGDIPDVVSRHGPWRHHDFYVAGSPTMVESTLRRLTEMQIPSTRIKYDAFTDA